MPRATDVIGNVDSGTFAAAVATRRVRHARDLVEPVLVALLVGVGAPGRRRGHVDVLLLPERGLDVGRELGSEPHDPRLVLEVDDGHADCGPHRVSNLGSTDVPAFSGVTLAAWAAGK